MMTSTEGTVEFRGYRTWYRIVGDLRAPSGKLPLLLLHGGPGLPHDYLEDLSGLAEQATLLMTVGYRVANAAAFPEWKPGNEFRAVRDKALSKK